MAFNINLELFGHISIQSWINNGKHQELHRQDWSSKKYKRVIQMRNPTVLSGVWAENNCFSFLYWLEQT